MKSINTLLANAAVLVLLGVLAGTLGGIGVGLLTNRTATSSTNSTSQ
jgi:hypothetical protein